jgi:hypothetical protein
VEALSQKTLSSRTKTTISLSLKMATGSVRNVTILTSPGGISVISVRNLKAAAGTDPEAEIDVEAGQGQGIEESRDQGIGIGEEVDQDQGQGLGIDLGRLEDIIVVGIREGIR